MTIKDEIIAFMSDNPNVEFSSKDIADKFVYELYVETHGHKEPSYLQSVIHTNIKQLRNKYSQLKYKEGSENPRIYYWEGDKPDLVDRFEAATKSRQENNIRRERKEKKDKNEEGLYKPLIEFLKKEKGMYARRIDEKKSANKGGKGRNKWRHPDVVGVKGLISDKDLHPMIKQIAEVTMDKAELYAFEVKVVVPGNLLRDYFHQTVANSIWANYGFLCAERFDRDADTDKELKQLNNAYGIGFIIINRKNPKESHILIEAKRKKVDLEICSTLTKDNIDFSDFISRALDVYKTGNVRFY